MDLEILGGRLRRTERDFHPRPVPHLRICDRRAGTDAGQGRTEGLQGLDQGADERRAGRSSYRRFEAAQPPARSRRGLYRLLRGQRGPNALRSLPEARITGRSRRCGKRLQAHRRKPIQRVGMQRVESGHQRATRLRMLPRKHALARLPQLEGWSCCIRLTKTNGMQPLAPPYWTLSYRKRILPKLPPTC